MQLIANLAVPTNAIGARRGHSWLQCRRTIGSSRPWGSSRCGHVHRQPSAVGGLRSSAGRGQCHALPATVSHDEPLWLAPRRAAALGAYRHVIMRRRRQVVRGMFNVVRDGGQLRAPTAQALRLPPLMDPASQETPRWKSDLHCVPRSSGGRDRVRPSLTQRPSGGRSYLQTLDGGRKPAAGVVELFFRARE